MSNPNPNANPAPWGKIFAIGCGSFLLMLLLCTGVFTWFGWKGFQFFQVAFQEAQKDIAAQADAVDRWDAPARDDAVAAQDAFAVARVNGFELKSRDKNANFPALGIEREGDHFEYVKEGQTIDVTVYPADVQARDDVFDGISDRIKEERFPNHKLIRFPNSLTFSINDPPLHGFLLHAKGWLIFARSDSVESLRDWTYAYLGQMGERPEEPSGTVPAGPAVPVETGPMQEPEMNEPSAEPAEPAPAPIEAPLPMG